MSTTPTRSVLRRWPLWLGLGALGELAWFALLHPLLPRTFRAAFVEALLLLPIVGYWYLVCCAVVYLADKPLTFRIRQAIGLLLAVSAVVFAVAALWVAQRLLGAEFGREFT
jgi:hypothetical protein